MVRWVRRMAGIALAGLGIACLWLPWSDSRPAVAEISGAEVRFVGEVLPADDEFPSGWVALDGALRSDVPRTAQRLAELDPQTHPALLPWINLPARELLRLRPEEGAGDRDLDVVLDDRHVRLECLELPVVAAIAKDDPDAGALERDLRVRVVEVNRLVDAGDATPLERRRLDGAPDLLAVLGGEFSIDRAERGLSAGFVPDEDLAPLRSPAGDLSASFVLDGRLYAVHPAVANETRGSPIAGLRVGLRTFGALVLAASILLLRGLYRRPPEGIPVVAPGLVIGADLVLTAFVMLSWIPVVDVVLSSWLGTRPVTGDEPLLLFSGAAIFLFAVPWAALRSTAILAQALRVDDQWIRLSTWLGEESIAWSRLESVDTEARWIAVRRVGWTIPRHYETRLVLRGPDATLEILEPTSATKRRIIDALWQQAPVAWKERIAAAGADW